MTIKPIHNSLSIPSRRMNLQVWVAPALWIKASCLFPCLCTNRLQKNIIQSICPNCITNQWLCGSPAYLQLFRSLQKWHETRYFCDICKSQISFEMFFGLTSPTEKTKNRKSSYPQPETSCHPFGQPWQKPWWNDKPRGHATPDHWLRSTTQAVIAKFCGSNLKRTTPPVAYHTIRPV